MAGAYAGQIRDYAYSAGAAALRTGTAERVLEDVVAPVATAAATSAGTSSATVVTKLATHKQQRQARVAPARGR